MFIAFFFHAGEEHSCESHVQDRQSPPRAGLLPQDLQPGGLRGPVPEEPAVSPRPALFRPPPPTPHPAPPHGSQPDGPDSIQSSLETILLGN